MGGASPVVVGEAEEEENEREGAAARGYAYKAEGAGMEIDGGEADVVAEEDEDADKGPPKRDEEVEAWDGRAEGRILNGLKDHVDADVADEGLFFWSERGLSRLVWIGETVPFLSEMAPSRAERASSPPRSSSLASSQAPSSSSSSWSS